MTLALTRTVEACMDCSRQICKLCRRDAPLSADKEECDGCRKCTSGTTFFCSFCPGIFPAAFLAEELLQCISGLDIISEDRA
jgi:hypothetical protein